MVSRGPLGPEEILGVKTAQIPEAVFEVVNRLIAKQWDGQAAVVKQPDIVDALVAEGYPRKQVYEEHWLDVEESYRAVGWTVTYDRPGYNETYEPTYEFRRK